MIHGQANGRGQCFWKDCHSPEGSKYSGPYKNSQMNGLAAQYGGLASLAGIPIPGGGGGQTDLLLEILQSRSFLSKFPAKQRRR